MKKFYTLATLVLSLSPLSSFASDCTTPVSYLVFMDAAAIYCKDGCNVIEMMSQTMKKDTKPGSLSIETTPLSFNDNTLKFFVTVKMGQGRKVAPKLVSEYEVTTSPSCMLQTLTRTN